MSKMELQKQLLEMGVKYDGRWSESKLQALIDEHSEKKQEITNEEVVVPRDHFIPQKDNGWRYTMEENDDSIDIVRKKYKHGIMYNGSNEFIRTYSLKDHGEGYRELANQFVDKNNRK